MRLKPQQFAIAVVVAAVLLFLIFMRTRPSTFSPFQPESAPAIANPERSGPPEAYPDPARTPGFANAEITQANIGETICNPNWSTRRIRPPASYTSKLKRQQMRDWGLPGAPADYEEDHLISLELGGSPTDPRNLWPEAYDPRPGAKEKDTVENYLHKEVCSGALTLEEARKAIATDWYRVYLQIR